MIRPSPLPLMGLLLALWTAGAAAAGPAPSPEGLGAALLQIAGEAAPGREAFLRLVEAHLAAGDRSTAEAEVDALLTAAPDDIPGGLVKAALLARRGEADAAERMLRRLVTRHPTAPGPHRALADLLEAGGATRAAGAALDEGIAATGGDAGLRARKAALFAAAGEYREAAAIYEGLHRHGSSDPWVANALARLLSAHLTDEASLARAERVARRLRGSRVPEFQHTYGWILLRLGDTRQALAYLEPAAAARPEDALLQFHLGIAYGAAGREAEAAAALRRALRLGDLTAEHLGEARRRLAAAAPAAGR